MAQDIQRHKAEAVLVQPLCARVMDPDTRL